MSNIIKPAKPQEESIPLTNAPVEKGKLDDSLGLTNVEFAQYLGEDRFDPDVMEKIEVLAEHYQSLDGLMDADVHLGKRMDMTKLDKLYSYAMLSRQEAELEVKTSLIQKAKEEYVSSNSSVRP